LKFGIFKPLGGPNTGMWLTRAEPFVTWGLEPSAARFPTQGEAWQVIGRLSREDGNGAAVVALE
jgi:hypothetical protein